MSVTRKDVAKLANVSVATVSYVLNNTKHVTPEVRTRVLDAAKALDYHPNLIAKSLSTKETKHIAMLVDNIENPHYVRLLMGIQHVAIKHGYIVSILPSSQLEENNGAELVGRGIDGIILATEYSTKDIAKYHIPIICANSSACINYRPAIFNMVKVLQDLGHKKIAFLSGLSLDYEQHTRYHDFKAALEYYKLEINDALFINGKGLTDEQAGYDSAEHLLATGLEFTAVFALNDLMAIGAMRRFSEAGLRIPEDISLIGCDGIKETLFTMPSLSTLHSHTYTFGKQLMSHLLNVLNPQSADITEFSPLQAELIIRESIGRAPLSDFSNNK